MLRVSEGESMTITTGSMTAGRPGAGAIAEAGKWQPQNPLSLWHILPTKPYFPILPKQFHHLGASIQTHESMGVILI